MNISRMFGAFLDTIPKNRLEMVEELELPEVQMSPFYDSDRELESLPDEDACSLFSDEAGDDESVYTDSSMPLSRAMTDSDIDYDRYRRYKGRRYSTAWELMKSALDAFPDGYLSSLDRFITSSPPPPEEPYERDLRHREERALKLESFLEECNVFQPDDPGLTALEEAIAELDLKALYTDCDKPSYDSLVTWEK